MIVPPKLLVAVAGAMLFPVALGGDCLSDSEGVGHLIRGDICHNLPWCTFVCLGGGVLAKGISLLKS